MSRTLNFCEHLLFEGRRQHALGADHHAIRSFSRLSGLHELPAEIAEDTQLCLAELMLKQRKFAKARRHLAAALTHDPANAHYHFLMASAHESDRRGDRKQALFHYRQCVQLDSENTWYHCDAGLFAIQHGDLQQGLRWLRAAAQLAPDDAEVIGEVLRGLQEKGLHEEARQIALAARFRNARDPNFEHLWNDVCFRELHQHQQKVQKRRIIRRAEDEGRICLPFLDLTVQTPRGRKLVRKDGPSGTPTPHRLRRIEKFANRKHA